MSQCEQNRDAANSRILTKLYEDYGPFIQSILRFALKNQQDREDVYQDIFMALFLRDDLSEMQHEVQNMKAYLYRLVINKANEFLRLKIGRQGKFKEYAEKLQSQSKSKCKHAKDTHEQATEMMELIQEYLTPKLASAIAARFHHNYNNEKAAEEMKVKKKTIIHNASMGLKKIRTIIKRIERAEKQKEGDNYEL